MASVDDHIIAALIKAGWVLTLDEQLQLDGVAYITPYWTLVVEATFTDRFAAFFQGSADIVRTQLGLEATLTDACALALSYAAARGLRSKPPGKE